MRWIILYSPHKIKSHLPFCRSSAEGIGLCAPFPHLVVVGESALKPARLPAPFERQNVRRYPVQEPAVVRNDHHASSEILKSLFKGAERSHIEVVGWFVEQE